jgi:hypothetical protein
VEYETWLTVKEVQRLLRCSQNTVLRRIWRGDIPARVADGWYMIREVDALEYKRTTQPINSRNPGRFTGHDGPRPSNYGRNGKGR